MQIIKKIWPSFTDFSNYLKSFLFVFTGYFLVAKASLYVYYEFSTSPALIWPPVGVALAVMYFEGYRILPAILLAQFLSVISYNPQFQLIAFIIAVAYTLQAAVGLYVMRRFGFEPSLYKLRNTIILLGIAFLVTTIEPLIATIAQMYLYPSFTEHLFNFGRAWGAGIFSSLVVTPFLFTWSSFKRFFHSYTKRQGYEIITAFLLLIIIIYILFWTPYPAFLGITAVFILPAVLIWFALSLEIRWTTLALVLTSLFGFAGTIIASPTTIPINEQLLASQIYLGLVAAIFLVFVAVVEDRRRMYRSLKKNYGSTLNSDRSKSEFIAVLAHELRNPLASMVSLTELLQLKSKNTDSKKIIENIKLNAKTMTRILDDLLDTVRLSQRKFRLQKEEISLQQTIEQVLLSKSELLKRYRHNFSISLPPEDVLLFADPVRLKQIMINLVGNACKYTNPGGKIELSVAVSDEWVVVRITDNGIGMDNNTIQHIFEPFNQSEQAIRQDDSGIGIGLFLTKELVEMHGGRIEASSGGLGKGSIFSVYLPIVSYNSKKTDSSLKLQNHSTPENNKVRFRILIVDDNQDVASALMALLGHYGHEVAIANSGRGALETLDVFNPEVVFLDIGMSEMDGYETAQRIRTRGWQGKMIALSGYGQESDLITSKNAGFYTHLIKPVGIEKILEILSDLDRG